jgi:uncharacterized membrane protein
VAASYSFTFIRDPLSEGFSTVAYGVNDLGQIVGSYAPFGNPYYFIDKGGIFTTLPPIGGSDLIGAVNGINSTGQIVGSCSNGTLTGELGFVYSDGVYTTLSDPSAVGSVASGGNGAQTLAFGINNLGQVVGWYGASASFEGLFTATAFIRPSRIPSQRLPLLSASTTWGRS